jgi:hypothetical protein
MGLSRGARWVLRAAGVTCIATALFPSCHGTLPLAAGDTVTGLPSDDVRLGLPFSPLFRSFRMTTGSPPPETTLEDGSTEQSSWFTATVYGFEIQVLSWSAALCALGAALVLGSLRRRSRGEP